MSLLGFTFFSSPSMGYFFGKSASNQVYLSCLPIILLMSRIHNEENIHGQHTCIQDWRNNVTKCRPNCDNGSFSLFGMPSCHPWLTCEDIKNDVQILDYRLGHGAVKMVYLARWRGYNVAVSRIKNSSFADDFEFNLKMFSLFNADADNHILQHLVQFIGYCNSPEHVLVTEYHFFGSADNVDVILQTHLPYLDTISTRFSLCVDFITILNKLHTHIDGARVLCDSNTPEKALSQFLLSDDLKLLLNDMDALPVVNAGNKYTIKCGHRELFGDYVAPEQLWPYGDEPFDDRLMPGYDEKVDIWKVPDVCLTLIGKTVGTNKLLIHLFNIHSKCKNEQAQRRPTASEVLQVYKNIVERFNFDLKQKIADMHIHDML